MARPIWSGAISFGLVNIPVKLYSAVEDKGVHLHLLTSDGKCRLRRKLYCPETNKEYDFNDTARGYEIAPGQYVIIQQEELDSLKPDAGRTIDIKSFVDLKSIDPLYYNKPYYVLPDSGSARAFSLLKQAMQESDRVAIAKFVMRNKEYLAALRVMDDVICLETMRFDDEVRKAETYQEELKLPTSEEVDNKELKLATQLIDALYEKFNPEVYHDEYRDRVQELVEKKAEGAEITIPEDSEARPAKVVDLMAALKKSVEAKKKGERKKPGKRKTG